MEVGGRLQSRLQSIVEGAVLASRPHGPAWMPVALVHVHRHPMRSLTGPWRSPGPPAATIPVSPLFALWRPEQRHAGSQPPPATLRSEYMCDVAFLEGPRRPGAAPTAQRAANTHLIEAP
jgi:hypothetical protein